MVLCNCLCPLDITKKLSETHTAYVQTPMGRYDYLSGRSPLATDLLIEQTFFLPFNLRRHQSRWRIK